LSEILKMYIGLHVNCLLFLYDFNATWIFWQIKKKTQISNFMKIHRVETELFHADIQTDRHDEATSHICELANACKKETFSRSNLMSPFCLSLLGCNYLSFRSLGWQLKGKYFLNDETVKDVMQDFWKVLENILQAYIRKWMYD
jgi:hypothetical protein